MRTMGICPLCHQSEPPVIGSSVLLVLFCDCEACGACLHRFGSARSPSEVSESLRQIILRLYDKHLASDGKALNYKALKQDPVFKTYVNATAELQNVDVVSLSREERMAFFINIYNAVVVHALAVFGPASNLKQRSGSPTMLIFALCMNQAFVRVLHAAAVACVRCSGTSMHMTMHARHRKGWKQACTA